MCLIDLDRGDSPLQKCTDDDDDDDGDLDIVQNSSLPQEGQSGPTVRHLKSFPPFPKI